MPARQPFINERPQTLAPESDVVPVQKPKVEPAPPRRFAPLASIEPDDNEPETPPVRAGHMVHPSSAHATSPVVHQAPQSAQDPEPAYADTVEPAPKSQPLADADLGMPLGDDDLDVPAFIRRKVD
jgi:hypothetical protein